MELEVGKWYRTRGGEKARIVAYVSTFEYPAIGYIEGGASSDSWTSDGYCLVDVMDDLIAPWEEPKPHLYAYLYTPFPGAMSEVQFLRESDAPSQVEGQARRRRAPWLDEPEEVLTSKAERPTI